ncbi:PilX N-terminal domain-containing pilus assembly protein [Ramlibacter sp. H39-3-26]|uniref:pilus assembly PilX family protein n=1 Tax=Curvibacter soli TaxID=3031331 RepID=UPI0023DC3A73|nr:PilX N-terminal domain-containing pilus assembly protein [Ramlibacter sp. H39-3-26]MDF1483652.1 PilX N-terminal domain-containing pilus assembly protein [Ramlibacter sp. H39-3-26]
MHTRSPRRQGGVALIVVLLFLVAIVGVTVWTVRQSMLSEGMARNQLDQEVARQAAEAALRDAERDIRLGTPPPGVACTRPAAYRNNAKLIMPAFAADCAQGLCYKADDAYKTVSWDSASSDASLAEPWWPTGKNGQWNDDAASKPPSGSCAFTGAVPLGTYTGIKPLPSVSKQPEYLIEVFKRKDVRINAAESMVTSTGENASQWSTMYRITARGFGYSQMTQVVLQSIFFP